MAANIVSPAQSGRFYYGCMAPPGCWRAWRSYSGFQPWPAGGRQILVRIYHAMPYVMIRGGEVADIPLVAYATLTLSGFRRPLSSGHSKLPIVAWAVQPALAAGDGRLDPAAGVAVRFSGDHFLAFRVWVS